MNISKEPIERRKFIKITGAGIALLSFSKLLTKVNAKDILQKHGTKKRYAMVIDLRRCIACEACTIACKVENNVPTHQHSEPDRKIQWNEVIFKEKGKYPYSDINFWPRPCMHCENPTCVKACPVKATYKDEERGLVLQKYDKCIGCRYCAINCPYGARYFNFEEPNWPKERENTFNPEVERRYKGIVEKCTFCIHRIKRAERTAEKEQREIHDKEIQPACVITCMGKARFFGDLNDPESEVSKLVKSGRAYRLEEHLGTEPKVFYLKDDER